MPANPISDEECARRWQAIAARNGNAEAAARDLGMSPGALRQWRINEARKGNAPGHFENGVAPGYLMGTVTVQRNSQGDIERTWERQTPDLVATRRALNEVLEAMAEAMPRADPVPAFAGWSEELCNLYTFSDFHLGMLAWHREGGADWDLKIAEAALIGSFAAMIEQSPKARACVLNIQGDFLHTDGKLPLTPAHKHVLDADGRYPKIRKVAIRTLRQLVRMALERHETVHVIIVEGNHDEEGSGWLADLLEVHYEDEPRVSVNDSNLPFYVFQWGDTMLGFHHGHKVKNEQLPALFSAQFRKLWGDTTRAYIHCGHRHHCDEKEYNGAIVIQHPTIAARDAHAARGGWIADRAVQAITYHRRFGQVGRVFVTPEMLAA